MEITITKADLAKALSVAQSIVQKKTTMPILSNVLLAASGEELKVSATDLEVTVTLSSPAQVKRSGATTVGARVFAEMVRELPEGDITLKVTEGERLEIITSHGKFRMNGVNADEYPSLPGVNLTAKATVAALTLLEMINKTIYAVSTDETRFNLNGICFKVEGQTQKKFLQLVATDGHRLAMIKRPAGKLDFKEEAIVPRKGLAEMRKLLDGGDGEDVCIDLCNGFFLLETPRAKMAMRLIDGEFPDYSQVLPTDTGEEAKLRAGDLIQALRRAALMVSDSGKCVKLDFTKNNLKISSSSPELGDAVEELAVDYKGEALSVGFNARYLLDLASAMDEDEQLIMELHGEVGPGKFYPENDESYVSVVMPMRLT